MPEPKGMCQGQYQKPGQEEGRGGGCGDLEAIDRRQVQVYAPI